MATYQQQLKTTLIYVHSLMAQVRADPPDWPQIAANGPLTILQCAVLCARLVKQALDPSHTWDDSDAPPMPNMNLADAQSALDGIGKKICSLSSELAKSADPATILAAVDELLIEAGPILLQIVSTVTATLYPNVKPNTIIVPNGSDAAAVCSNG